MVIPRTSLKTRPFGIPTGDGMTCGRAVAAPARIAINGAPFANKDLPNSE